MAITWLLFCLINVNLIALMVAQTGNDTQNVTTTTTATTAALVRSCQTSRDCRLNEFCANKTCQCQTNYKINNNGICEKFSCSYNWECEPYDKNRECNYNGCECKSPYLLNTTSQLCTNMSLTIPYKYCYGSIYQDCSANQFCVNNKCECLAGYKYNPYQNYCESQACDLNADCQQFDKNRVCSPFSGQCLCKSGYTADPYDHMCYAVSTTTTTTTTASTVPYKYCVFAHDCDMNQVCVGSKCQCRPGLSYSLLFDMCTYRKCKSNSDCNFIDSYVTSNRNCSSGDCICTTGYRENANTLMCELSINSQCFTNYKCDKNQICVAGSCQCEPNYKWSDIYVACVLYECSYDSDCQRYDSHRYCKWGHINSCLCKDGYRSDPDSEMCVKDGKDLNWLWILLIIPIGVIIVTLVLAYRMKKVTFRSQRNAHLAVNQPVQAIPTSQPSYPLPIHADAVHSQTQTEMYDPPPPYSRY